MLQEFAIHSLTVNLLLLLTVKTETGDSSTEDCLTGADDGFRGTDNFETGLENALIGVEACAS